MIKLFLVNFTELFPKINYSMKKVKIPIPIYFGELIIIQENNWEPLEKKYNLPSLDSDEACCFRYDKKDGFHRYVLLFRDNCNARIIAHESLHVLSYIFEDRNINFSITNDEPQCYLLGWLVGVCTNFLKVDNNSI